MYPETDIPPIIVTDNEINFAKKNIPKSWDESLLVLQKKYDLKPQLAEQIFDSEYLELFEKICTDKNSSPNFVASILCSTITNLERRDLDASLLKSEEIIKSFEFLNQGKITKESIEIIFEQIMSGKTQSVEEAIQKTSMISLSEDELEEICNTVISDNSAIIDAQGLRAIGPLMGSVMKSTRGKASGEKVNLLLQKMIKEYLGNNK
jgi:glutamyl-tRNA(Gln) amidotransferase subunit E